MDPVTGEIAKEKNTERIVEINEREVVTFKSCRFLIKHIGLSDNIVILEGIAK